MSIKNTIVAECKSEGYEVMEQIGRGATSGVWKAKDSNNEFVAIKVVSQNDISNVTVFKDLARQVKREIDNL